MEFVHFPQATGFITNGEGKNIPLLCEDGIAVAALEFTDAEIKEMKRYGNRIYLATPIKDGRPVAVIAMIRLPLATKMTVNKDADEKKD